MLELSSSQLTPRQVERLRDPKTPPDPWRPIAALREWEPSGDPGRPAEVLAVFLAGAECPLRCTMCDLWRHTLDGPTPAGALPGQLRIALATAPPAPPPALPAEAFGQAGAAATVRWIKLYNASNFFDPRAVPPVDWAPLARQLCAFERVIVECHPRWIRPPIARFAALLQGRLEVAIGMETVHPGALRLLNKQMPRAMLRRAIRLLTRLGIDSRAFVLLQPPGVEPTRAVDWALATVRAARRLGVRHVSLIPTRGGNGAMEWLAARGDFLPPTASALQQALQQALQRRAGQLVTADLWDWDRLPGHCQRCREPRRLWMQQMNLAQRPLDPPRLSCRCGLGQPVR